MKALEYFKALADETRIRLFTLLGSHELNVHEITEILRMGQSRVSRHLKILSDCGLLTARRDGLWSFYSVPDTPDARRFAGLVREAVAGEAVLAEDGREAEKVIRARKDRTREFFDAVASHWEYMKKELFGDIDIIGLLLETVPSCRTIADLGCGTGDLLHALLGRAERVIGVDNSSRMLDEARRRFGADRGRADFRLGELSHLPLRDGEAECAVIAMVLHHLQAPEVAVGEAARVLEPGGTLVVMDFDKHENEMLRERFSDRWLGFGMEGLCSFLSGAGLATEVTKRIPVLKGLVVNIASGKKQAD
ncbi:MAG: metalloregulator ArsR/SmtB family transcription factor [Spirochaetales bacterium]|nr:metalloregulator ArsR/SmtB family transcription factor [Spirochaetales bacterium]